MEIWVSKSNTTHDNTITHKNKVVEEHEFNPFALPSVSECQTIAKSAKAHSITEKSQSFKKNKDTFFNASTIIGLRENVSKSCFESSDEKHFKSRVSFYLLFEKEKKQRKAFMNLSRKNIKSEMKFQRLT